MSLSLRELKEYLKSKGGYSIEPNHSQLQDLKDLVDDMMEQRSGTPPSSGSGYYSGTTCISHTPVGDYNLSLGDINTLDIKGCSCNEVNNTTGYCTSRTSRSTCTCNVDYYCNCVSRTYASTCTCNTRTGTCSCRSRGGEPNCMCDLRESGNCNCDLRSSCTCHDNSPCTCQYVATCLCVSRTPTGVCSTRTSPISCECNVDTYCDCRSRTYASTCYCNTRTGTCECVSRTSLPTCTCNGRCACNVENRFE